MSALPQLTLTDPLADKEVRIIVHIARAVAPGTERSARDIVVAVGVEGSPPRMLTGTFGQFAELVDEAWRTYPATAGTIAEATVATTPDPNDTAPPTTRTGDTAADILPTTVQQSILDLF